MISWYYDLNLTSQEMSMTRTAKGLDVSSRIAERFRQSWAPKLNVDRGSKQRADMCTRYRLSFLAYLYVQHCSRGWQSLFLSLHLNENSCWSCDRILVARASSVKPSFATRNIFREGFTLLGSSRKPQLLVYLWLLRRSALKISSKKWSSACSAV